MDVRLYVTQPKYQQLMAIIDRALSQFDGKPPEEGFDMEIYNELRKVRETIVRVQRDLRDKNITRDSHSPLESA